jgi:hypothetical protein
LADCLLTQKNKKLLTRACQPLYRLWVTHVDDYDGVKNYSVVSFDASQHSFPFLGQRIYDDDVQFNIDLFFFRFIFLSYALIFTLPVENITAAFKLLFLSGLDLVLFEKITLN